MQSWGFILAMLVAFVTFEKDKRGILLKQKKV